MPRTLTVQPKTARRVAQVRAGQTSLAEPPPAPASPLEQLAQIDALMAAPDKESYRRVVVESGWAKLKEAELVNLEEKSRALGEKIARGKAAIAARTDGAPLAWVEKLGAYIEEQGKVDEQYLHALWAYERQTGIQPFDTGVIVGEET